MCNHPKPPDIGRTCGCPGEGWSDEAMREVKEWLCEIGQLAVLVSVAQANLGPHTTQEDAEEAWHQFFAWRLNAVIRSFDPARHPLRCFWPFLLGCFRRWCWDESERRQRERAVIRPAETTRAGVQPVINEAPAPSFSANPTEVLIRRETGEILARAIAALREPYRGVFILREVEGLSQAETAQRYPEHSYQVVANWYHRARLLLRRWLEENFPGFWEGMNDE